MSRTMTLGWVSLAVVLVLGAVTSLQACDEDDPPFQDRNCGDKIVLRCRWNAATMHYDLDCVTIPPDAGFAACDGGAPG
jgi:hypothetical protein